MWTTALLTFTLLQISVVKNQQVISLTKCQSALDLIFLLDGSQSVKEANFKLVKQYTIDLISKFEVNPSNTRVGIVEFSTIVNPKIELGQYDTFQQLSQAIGQIQMSNFGTSTHEAISYMRKMFKQSPRDDAIKVGVCITDGLSVSPNFTQIEAKRSHAEGIIMFALGIGPNVFRTELKFIASKEEYVKEVSDYSALPTNLAMEICNLHQSIPLGTTANLEIDRIDENYQNGSTRSATTSSPIINEGSVDTNREFLAHPTDCAKFLETEDVAGIKVVHEKTCPFGQLYNENALTCVEPKYSTCKFEQCNNQTTIPMAGNCAGFWVCFQRDVKAVCCPQGTGFVTGLGCQPGICDAPCPPLPVLNSNLSVCSLSAVPNDPTVYLEFVTGHGNITRRCAPGTAFNQSSCGCSTSFDLSTQNIQGTANPTITTSCTTNLYLPFNKRSEDSKGMMDWSGMSTPMSCNNINVTDGPDGKALFGYSDCFIYIWRFASIDFRNLQIKFEFSTLNITANTELQAILTNCYPSPTCSPSFAILLDRMKGTLGIKFITGHGNNERITYEWIKIKVDQTNNVEIDIKEKELLILVNGQMTSIHIDGQINKRQSGFAFGLGGPYKSFEGYLDEVKISSC